MKFCGSIGFWFGDVEEKPGLFVPHIMERSGYRGEVTRNMLQTQQVSNQQNADLKLNNQISIISDLYLQKNWSSIRYVVWNGVKCSVTNVTMGYPRIVLEIGGVYRGPEMEVVEKTSN